MDLTIPGVDAEKGLDLYDGEMDIYVAVLRSYLTNTPAVLDRLRNVSADTLPDYIVGVHGVKGTSTTIGAEETRKAALKLELMAKAGDLSGVLAENNAFLKQADKLIDDIRRWLEQFEAKGG